MSAENTHRRGSHRKPQDTFPEALMESVLGLSRQLRALGQSTGLTPTELIVLHLLRREGPATASDLARQADLNPTLLSRVLGSLESAGYVQRTRAEHDGRCTVVEMTAEGRSLLKGIRAKRAGWLAGRLEQLTGEQVRALVGALPALAALCAPASKAGEDA